MLTIEAIHAFLANRRALNRSQCWCGGFSYGSAGAVNRAVLTQGMTVLLEQHGFNEGETAYIEQKALPLEVA